MNKVSEIIERLKFYDDALNFACRENNIPKSNQYVTALSDVYKELEEELKELLKHERKE
jgi:hypothetical protein